MENIKLLEADSGGMDVAFLQGGTGTLATADALLSLGSLYFERLWFFGRADISFSRVSDLVGKRIAVGQEGSGTRILSMLLLELYGLTSSPTQIVSEGGNSAQKCLSKGGWMLLFL